MPIEITVPRLGWSMEEGLFVGWAKSAGDRVQSGEVLYSLESDKATQEVESIDAGVLSVPAGAPKAGDRVVVGQLLGYLLQPGERLTSDFKASGPGNAAQEPRSGLARPAAGDLGVGSGVDERVGAGAKEALDGMDGGAGPKISPRARRVARELGVAWGELRGSGASGRIREADVRAASGRIDVGAVLEDSGAELGERVELSAVRRTIAERMRQSCANTAPVTLFSEVDATELVAFRERRKASGGPVPGYHDCLARLLARALAKHPRLNARWEGEALRESGVLNLGIAVDAEAGLMVPVLRNVGALTLDQIAERSRGLIERARARRLAAAEMKGGTFTLTNLGAYGVDAFTPILNYPECGILGVGRIRKAPAVVDGALVIRDSMALSLTFDHCALDGGPAARFLQCLAGMIESPGEHLES